ncbi:IS1096 element passenger TnpR family protein [Halovenus halobia]|uniref:IS1096 element passenger TnpR family protein n=1 Tax=Halovenus halobia TaxID=3396622 RepID=UPI003F56A32E
MTAYRFRVKFEPDPTAVWRDILVGSDRTVTEFQSTINQAFSLDDEHLWFFGTDEDYWDSKIKYQSPQEFDGSVGVDPISFGERVENAGETTIGEMTRQVGLEQYDRICYLYDYGDEWQFYAILKEISSEELDDKEPEVVKEKGEGLEQYDPPGQNQEWLPEPLDTELPETAVPTKDLRALEKRDGIEHVIPLLSLETGFGTVSERFMIQYEDVGYVLENFKPGWDVVEEVDGTGTSEEELLTALADAARDWHAEIAEMSGAATGQHFDEQTVEAMHVELEAELERKGYGHL